MTEHERRCMDYWLTSGARAVWRVTPAKEWVQLALQCSTTEPAVMLAITAFASVQKSVGMTMHRSLEPVTARRDDVDTAMQQFSKATSALGKCIDRAIHGHGEVEPVLICCILLLCFEIGRGKFQNAMAHLDFARRIITGADLMGGRAPVQKKLTGFSSQATDDFGHLFSQVESSAIVTGTPVGLDQDSRQLESVSGVLSAPFSSLAGAKEQLNLLVTASSDVQNELFQLADARITDEDRRMLHPGMLFAITHCLSRTIIPSKVLHTRIKGLKRAFEHWTLALDSLAHVQDHQSFLFAATLRLQHLVAANNFRHCTSAHETTWDEHGTAEAIGSTLDLIECFLASPPTNLLHGPNRPEGKQQSSFALEPAVNPALALIALKCRDTRMRRRALHILSTARRREGLGYSESMAWFISVYVDAEEEAARQSLLQHGPVLPENLTADQVPEAARFLDMALYAETNEISRVVCARFRHESDGRLEVRQWRALKEPPVFEEIEKTVTGYHCQDS